MIVIFPLSISSRVILVVLKVDLYWKVICHCSDLILLSRSVNFDISRAYLETFLSSYPYGWFHGIFHLQFFAFQIEASASPLPQSLACHLLIPRLITALLLFLKLKIEEIYVINIEPKYSQIFVHH